MNEVIRLFEECFRDSSRSQSTITILNVWRTEVPKQGKPPAGKLSTRRKIALRKQFRSNFRNIDHVEKNVTYMEYRL